MYLVVVIGCSDKAPSSRGSIIERWRRQQPAHLFQIFRRVDADRVVGGFDGLDADAVLERAQLLERLGAFERRRLERGQHQQRAAPVGVEADVAVERRPAAARIARVGNRRARKIQREAGAIDHHLDDVRVGQLGRRVDAPVQRRHRDRRIGERRHASVIARGSSSGSSPCTLTTTSQSSVAATSASRSVPVG